ncbi:MAG TPA: helix-turn-helix transcriptional regulator [Flavobacterium sp.]|jgi:transcriptional regulator with XRE-family HTH domain|nr:helix-turn-helix transcriptional regulator [Flavobacterium sp.]
MVEKILIKIKKRRNELGYSQHYVSSQLNITQSSYNKIENGTTELSVAVLMKLCQILQLEYESMHFDEKDAV